MKKPILLLMAAGLFTFSSCDSGAENSEEHMEEETEQVGEDIEEGAEEVGDEIEQGAEEVEEGVEH